LQICEAVKRGQAHQYSSFPRPASRVSQLKYSSQKMNQADSAEKPLLIKNQHLKTPPKESRHLQKTAYESF
jgi:hypothetical protein